MKEEEVKEGVFAKTKDGLVACAETKDKGIVCKKTDNIPNNFKEVKNEKEVREWGNRKLSKYKYPMRFNKDE